jgi:predicted HTH domain antitoxin
MPDRGPSCRFNQQRRTKPTKVRSRIVARTLDLQIEVPNDASDEAIQIAGSMAREAAILSLQQQGELTLREAAAALDLTYEGYLDLLAARGLPAVNDDTDLEVAERLRASLAASRP